jgi:hypothetical protein
MGFINMKGTHGFLTDSLYFMVFGEKNIYWCKNTCSLKWILCKNITKSEYKHVHVHKQIIVQYWTWDVNTEVFRSVLYFRLVNETNCTVYVDFPNWGSVRPLFKFQPQVSWNIKFTFLQCKTNTLTIFMHQMRISTPQSLQWCSGRKSWKSEKKKRMWKLKEPWNWAKSVEG